MVVLSKTFLEQFGKQTCQSLPMHSGSCARHCLTDIPLYALSNIKQFTPVCLVSSKTFLRKDADTSRDIVTSTDTSAYQI